MNKCKKCGDFISEEFEICFGCNNGTTDLSEIKTTRENYVASRRFKLDVIFSGGLIILLVCLYCFIRISKIEANEKIQGIREEQDRAKIKSDIDSLKNNIFEYQRKKFIEENGFKIKKTK